MPVGGSWTQREMMKGEVELLQATQRGPTPGPTQRPDESIFQNTFEERGMKYQVTFAYRIPEKEVEVEAANPREAVAIATKTLEAGWVPAAVDGIDNSYTAHFVETCDSCGELILGDQEFAEAEGEIGLCLKCNSEQESNETEDREILPTDINP